MSVLDALHLEQDEVHVWWAHARPRATDLLAFLDPIEATRLSSLRRPADRDRFASAHVLTKVALAGYQHLSFVDEVAIRSECKVCGSEAHGKPVLHSAHPEFTFSLAYAGARVGIAVARCPVGIDVAMMSGDDESTRAAALAPAESKWLSGRPAAEWPHAVTLTWARKEALLKATGDGLSVPLADLVVSRPDEDPALVAWDGGPEPGDVQLVDLSPGAGHVGALAMLTNTSHGRPPFRVVENDGEKLLAAATEGPSIA